MHIVILGAGYAGLRAALSLEDLAQERATAVQITLIEQNPYHQLIQVLHKAAAGENGASKATVDLAEILDERTISLVAARVRAIEPLARRVLLDADRALPYDRLVIALGGESHDRGIPGVVEHSLPLRSYNDAVRLRKHILDNFTAAAKAEDPTERRILMTTAIVGAGYTGIQLAGEIADWLPELCAHTGAPRSEARIALLDRGTMLMPQFGSWADKDARRVLDSKGVSVYLNLGVTSVEPRLLRVSDGRVLRAATLVWAGGFRAPALLKEAGLPVDEQGRVLVDRYLRVEGQALIFAIGDCARVRDPQSGELVPATASYATRQGEHLAETLIAEVEGRAPTAYEPLKLGELVSVGTDYAIGDPLGVPLTGMPALLLKKGVEQWYRGTLFS